jgi:hypothetical protein
MPDSNLPIDDREWHVLMLGARRGPFALAELRALLETHPERWNASVWRPGMLDWRAAASIRALIQGAQTAQPLWIGEGAPLLDPPHASAHAARDASGALQVVSYEARNAPALARGLETASAGPTRSCEATAAAPTVSATRSLAVSGEWSLVVTSELRAISATELRALALKQSSAPATVSELRAIPKTLFQREAAVPALVLSEPTRTELPAFRFSAEDGQAVSTAREASTSSPPALPLRRPTPAPKRPSPRRALPLVLGGLVLLSALALILGLRS